MKNNKEQLMKTLEQKTVYQEQEEKLIFSSIQKPGKKGYSYPTHVETFN